MYNAPPTYIVSMGNCFYRILYLTDIASDENIKMYMGIKIFKYSPPLWLYLRAIFCALDDSSIVAMCIAYLLLGGIMHEGVESQMRFATCASRW